MAIKFVYFDLGGVVIKDFTGNHKWQEMKHDLGVLDKDSQAFDDFFDDCETKINIGQDIETFIPIFKDKFNIKTPVGYSWLADFVNRFEVNLSIWPLIKKVSQKYKIGLLTNMYPNMLSLIKSSHLLPDIKWDTIIDSSVVGLQKPDIQIFELAQKQAGVNADEIFFTDNTRRHVLAAQSLGWHTFLYNSSDPESSNLSLFSYLLTSSNIIQ